MATLKRQQPERAIIPPEPPLDSREEPKPKYDKPLPELEKIGALWKRKSKKGVVYLSGTCNDEQIMIFAVRDEYRQNPKSPHYTIHRSKKSDDDIPF